MKFPARFFPNDQAAFAGPLVESGECTLVLTGHKGPGGLACVLQLDNGFMHGLLVSGAHDGSMRVSPSGLHPI